MRTSTCLLAALLALALAGAACSEGGIPGSSDDPSVSVTVAPYELPLMSDACYALSVFGTAAIEDMNATSLVWTQPNLCASDYGAEGGIRFTGICDAQAGGVDDDDGAPLDPDHNNTVMLVLNDIYTGGEWDGEGVALSPDRDYINPCPEVEAGEDNGCILKVPCTANQDEKVLFNLTVMRDAQLGFFDAAVKVQDVFCAAKLDCVDDDNATLTYLHDPTAQPPGDGPTVVLGFACLGGEGEAISMYLDDLQLTCSTGSGEVTRTATVDPSGGPGNLSFPDLRHTGSPDVLFDAAVNTGEGFQGTQFWNVLLGLNLPGLPGETCTLHTTGAVSEAALDDNATPANTRFPFIDWTVDLTEDGNRTCTRHPLNGDDGGVETIYTPIDVTESFDHLLSLGAACPCWSPDTPGEAYLAQVQSIMAGEHEANYGYESEGAEHLTYLQAESVGGWMALLAGYSLNDSEGAGPGLYCMVIGQQGEAYVEYARQPISEHQVAACLDDMAELVDDPCRVNNGDCGSDYCLYVGPGNRLCGDCRNDGDCTGQQICARGETSAQCADCYDDCGANGQVCNASTHQCVQCLTAFDCTGDQLCTTAYQCVDCLGDTDCGVDATCNASGQCVSAPPPGPANGFDVTFLSTNNQFQYQGVSFTNPYPLVVATDPSGNVVGHYYPAGLFPGNYNHSLTLCAGQSVVAGTQYRITVMTNAASPCTFTQQFIEDNDWTWDEIIATVP